MAVTFNPNPQTLILARTPTPAPRPQPTRTPSPNPDPHQAHLYSTDAEYDEAFDAYLEMIGASSTSRDDHHVDFLEHALDVEREYRELSRRASPVTKGGYTQLTDEHEPATS